MSKRICIFTTINADELLKTLKRLYYPDEEVERNTLVKLAHRLLNNSLPDETDEIIICDLMDALPDHIENEINSVGENNVVINGNSSVVQKSSFGTSRSTISQGGNKIEIVTKNGKTTIKVNGKEYVEKETKK